MKKASSRIPTPLLALLLVSLAAMTLPLLATARGEINLTPDGVSYIAAARSFASSGAFQDFSGRPFTFWTPLYPVALAGLGAISPNLLDGIRWLNALTTAAAVFAAGLLLWRCLNDVWLTLLGVALAVFSRPSVTNAVHAISEPLFVLLTLVFLLTLIRAAQRQTWGVVIRLAFIAALACLQRYMGVTLIATGALTILLLFHRVELRQRVIYALAFSAAAGAPLALWFARNLTLTGVLVRDTAGEGDPLLENFALTHNTLAGWLLPDALANAIPPVLGVLLLLALAAGLIVAGWRSPRSDSIVRSVALERFRPHAVMIVALFFIVYVVALMALTLRPGYGPIGSRLLSPVYLPLVILALAGGERLIGALARLPMRIGGGERTTPASSLRNDAVRTRYIASARHDERQQPQTTPASSLQIGRWIPVIIVLVVGGVMLANAISRTQEQVDALRNWCCAAERGFDNALTDWLRTHDLAGRVYTNMPLPLYYTRRTMIFAPPELADWSETRAAYLVWFSDALADSCSPERFCARQNYALDDLRGVFDIEPIFESADGGVYRMNPRS